MNDVHALVCSRLLLIVAVLCFCFVLQHGLLSNNLLFVPSSVLTIAASALAGWIGVEAFSNADGDAAWLLAFGSHVFYFALLPFIVFNAGYHIRRSKFQSNVGAILVLALGGTWVCILLLALALFHGMRVLGLAPVMTWMQCVAFSSLLSSTDPVCTLAIFSVLQVDESLFYLVLGESVLNDAVALTVYRAATSLSASQGDVLTLLAWVLQLGIVFTLSAVFGYLLGIVLGMVVSCFDFSSDLVGALCLLLCMAPLAFLVAESLQGSGIVAAFFVGLSARRYVTPNVAADCDLVSVGLCLESAGYAAEVASVVGMGMALPLVPYEACSSAAVLFISLACLSIRASQVYGLLGLVNVARYVAHSAWRSGEYQTISEPLTPPALAHLSPADGPVVPAPRCDSRRSGPTLVPLAHMHMVWLSGLRGALNFALAALFPVHQDFVLSTTAMFVVLSIVVFGGLTLPLTKLLNIAQASRGSANRASEDSSTTIADWEARFVEPWVLKTIRVGSVRMRVSATFSHSVCCYQDPFHNDALSVSSQLSPLGLAPLSSSPKNREA